MYNKTMLMGRIANDLELKTTPSGVSVCSFRIAVDRRFQTKGEEKKTDFFNIIAWRQQAEFVSRYFKKGSMIFVDGELQTRQYTNKDGVNVTVTEIVADQISFTGEKRDDTSGSGQAAPGQTAQQTQPAANYQAQYGTPSEDDGGDYPF